MAKFTTSSLVVVLCALLLACLQGASSTPTVTTATTSSEVVFVTPHLNTQLYSNDGKNGTYPDLLDASISELQAGLERRDFSSVELVQAYLARIEEVNIHGPGLRAIIETSPLALQQAKKLDQERAAGKNRGALHGIPIVIKDNVATDSSLGMNTTAGSYTLLNSIVPGDSPSIATLRKAGAVILGKDLAPGEGLVPRLIGQGAIHVLLRRGWWWLLLLDWQRRVSDPRLRGRSFARRAITIS